MEEQIAGRIGRETQSVEQVSDIVHSTWADTSEHLQSIHRHVHALKGMVHENGDAWHRLNDAKGTLNALELVLRKAYGEVVIARIEVKKMTGQ